MSAILIDPTSLSEIEKNALRREYLKRQRAEIDALDELKPSERDLELASQLDGELFGPQRKFFDSPAKRKVGYCTRRAGKTMGIAREMLRVLLRNPTSLQIYFAQTSVAAKTYMWPNLKEIIRRKKLPITWHEQDLWLIHSRGGGKVILRGAEDNDDLDKHRGPAYIRVYIDEAGHFKKSLKTLVTEVAGPALRDHGGICYMTGTAGPKREGLFFEAVTGKLIRKSDGKPVWEVHEWSLQDNPHLSAEAKDETVIIDEDGFSGVDDPRFLREYRKVWAVDSEKRMFAFEWARNSYTGDLPEGHDWQAVIGVDFGWNDKTAIAMIFYSLTHPNCFIPETWGKAKQYTDDIAAEVFRFQAKYGRGRIVGDVGGAGKSPAMHLQRDYGIVIEAAKKTDKLGHIAFFNSALKRGELLVSRGDPLCTEFPKVEWNASRTGAANHARDDLCFAALYAWREAKSAGAASQLATPKSHQTDTLKARVIKEKVSVLNADDGKQAGYAHQRKPLSGRNHRNPRNGRSSLHQLIALSRP